MIFTAWISLLRAVIHYGVSNFCGFEWTFMCQNDRYVFMINGFWILCVWDRQRERETESETKRRLGSTCLLLQTLTFLHSEIQNSKIMQKLTQFAGSRQTLRGYGKNTDGHQALEGLGLTATPPPFCSHARRTSWRPQLFNNAAPLL